EAQDEAEEEAQEQELRLVIGQLQEFAERVQNGLAEADWSTRREIIRALVKRVEVDKEEVRVVYRVSPSPFVERPDGGILQDCGRRGHRALRYAHVGLRPLAVLGDPGPQPFLDETENPRIGDPVRDELEQPSMIDGAKEILDVRIEHPVHLLPHDSDPERVQRIVRAASDPEAIRKAQEVLL